MQFDEAVRYLLSLGHETVAIKLGLEKIELLLTELGSPQTSYPKVQLAGTNGKGSTAAMLESVYRAAALKVGLYTSPHLVSINERIRINGEVISDQDFGQLTQVVKEAAERLMAAGALESPPTFFEHLTAMALLAFREAAVDIAVLETGLGGRLDAVTASGAEMVGITPIAMDHQEYLGDSLIQIAAEKAAVVRPGSITVVSTQPPEAMRVIRARCDEVGVTPILADQVSVDQTGTTSDGRAIASFQYSGQRIENVTLNLRGAHQLENAVTALLLAEHSQQLGFLIPAEAIKRGLESVTHPGRLQLFESRPAVLLDGAHNPAGVAALCNYLDNHVHEPFTLVFGAMRDKALQPIAEQLFPRADKLILVSPANPRAAQPDELRALALPYRDETSTFIASSVPAGIELARSLTSPDRTILVTGSLYLVGEALAHLKREN